MITRVLSLVVAVVASYTSAYLYSHYDFDTSWWLFITQLWLMAVICVSIGTAILGPFWREP